MHSLANAFCRQVQVFPFPWKLKKAVMVTAGTSHTQNNLSLEPKVKPVMPLWARIHYFITKSRDSNEIKPLICKLS